MKSSHTHSSALDRYTFASEQAARQIIGAYSTSFGAATRMLGKRHRKHVRNIYALVRIADELVDGVTAEAGISFADQHVALNLLEADVNQAISHGYSSNAIVHAFAQTARSAHIDEALTAPFFASMRNDLSELGQLSEPAAPEDTPRVFDRQAHASYVYGSAEVVGLMCLRVFVKDEALTTEERAQLEHGARNLGAAFQNVNFLRDLADDTQRLGRSYLGSTNQLTSAQQQQWVATIREQLAEARMTLRQLPHDAQTAVHCALELFSKLTDLIAAVPASELYKRRIRVSSPQKAWIIFRMALSRRGRKSS